MSTERDNRLTLEEARAFAYLLNKYLPEETADYNLKRRIYSEQGDIPGVTSIVDEYVEYLKLLEEDINSAIIGLRKTIIQLSSNSDKFKRRHLERMFEKEFKND